MQPDAIESGAEKQIWKRKRNEITRPYRPYACRRNTYEPPEPGSSAASSAVTSPSLIASRPPRIHASIPRPPPIALKMKGIVMNGPIPTMSIMLSATPRQRPISRWSAGAGAGEDMRRGF